MVTSERAPASGFVRFMRKAYNPLGFKKGYNFVLWFIFDLALLGFCLARVQYWSFWGKFCNPKSTTGSSTPGDCYWYTKYDRNHYGIIIHLATIIPAGLLAFLQFVPIIRYKALIYHRIAGYVTILLALIGNGSAIAIANHAFGGDTITRVFVGGLAIATTGSLLISYWNVKCLQIEQHRAWMLRAWFYFGSIITLRIIMIIMTEIIGTWGGEATNWMPLACEEILYINGGNTTKTYASYPACDPSNSAYTGVVAVESSFTPTTHHGDAVTIQAALSSNFGAAGMLAWILHAVGVEIYLRLTPRESERLRKVSYERQLERGFKNPGSAGLVIEKFGDADPWVPPMDERKISVALRSETSPDSIERKREVSPVAVPAFTQPRQ